MSKVVYLDGTEELVFTRMLVDPNYRPDSPVDRWEIFLLFGFMQAAIYTGQLIVIEFTKNGCGPVNPHRLDRACHEIRKTLGLYSSVCETRTTPHYVEIRIRPSYKKDDPTIPLQAKVLLPPWPTTNFTP